MWTASSSEKKTYDPHPAGPYVARVCDVWESEQDNQYYGTKGPDGKIDERRTIVKVCVGFLTAESIEIDGVLKPRYTSFWATKSWHEKSNLRKFVAGFAPDLAKSDEVDPDALIGRTALVNVEQYAKKDGSMGHSVRTAMPVPKGMESLVPEIPADFVRHNDKPKP